MAEHVSCPNSNINPSAALASLGLVYDEEEMHEVFDDVSEGRNQVTFEQFIRFMEETEDQNSAEQVY